MARIMRPVLLTVIVVFTLSCFTYAGNTVNNNEKQISTDTDAVLLNYEEEHNNYDTYTAESIIFYSGNTYVKYAENTALALFCNTSKGNIVVEDKSNGFRWASCVSQSDVEAEQKNRLGKKWIQNLGSPFIIEYALEYGVKNSTLANFWDLNTVCIIDEIENGVRINYYLTKIGASFSCEVTLSENWIEVYIPFSSIEENPVETALSDFYKELPGEGEDVPRGVVLDIIQYPFLGSFRSTGQDGYFLVPDGPGGLIKLDEETSDTDRYKADVYGTDWTSVPVDWTPQGASLPLYGIKNGENSILAIVDKGAGYSTIYCNPAGAITKKLHYAYTQFIHRYVYREQINLSGTRMTVRSRTPVETDKSVRYVFISGENANYSGMASEYREYLMREQGMKREQKNGKIPLRLNLYGGTRQKTLLGKRFIKTTTFDNAEEIIERIYLSGLENVSIVYQGWMNGGADCPYPDRFPAEKELGGDDGLKDFVKLAHSYGYKVYLSDDYTWINAAQTSFNPRKNSVYDITGNLFNFNEPGIVKEWDWYILESDFVMESINKNMKKYREYNVDGLAINGLDWLHTNYKDDEVFYRGELIERYRNIAEYVSKVLGNTAVYSWGGSSYLLGSIDFMDEIPFDYSYYSYIDEVIPFYQMAIHGAVEYCSMPINFYDERKKELLKSVEYGAVPSFLVTYENSSVLADTKSSYIFSSQFIEWEDTIYSTYNKVSNALSEVRNEYITRHEILDDGVRKVTYENGVEIIVNYTNKQYYYKGLTVEPLDFIAVENGVKL